MMTAMRWLRAMADVLAPRVCSACQHPLGADEQWLCRRCLAQLPLTHLDEQPFNAMEQLFAGKTPIERATAYFYYDKSSPYAGLLHDIKYRDMPAMGRWLAERAMRQMPAFAAGFDVVVPVPLHAGKLASRGYNQSLHIARGVARATGAKVVEALRAVRAHSTQTHLTAQERWMNIQGVYRLAPGMERRLAGQRLLLVDDVVTTGSTLEVCARQLNTIPGAVVGLFTLAMARQQGG